MALDRKLHKLCQNTSWEKYSLTENAHNRSKHRGLSKDNLISIRLGNGFSMEANQNDIVGSVHLFDYFRDKNVLH